MKTNVIGLLMLASNAITLIFVWFGKATLTEVVAYMAPIYGILTMIGFFMAKDKKPNNNDTPNE